MLRVLIPKAPGGQRPLGLPTVLDRVIQQAIAQVIGPLCEPHFSTHSDGFRPGRRARMALAEMAEAHRDGLRYDEPLLARRGQPARRQPRAHPLRRAARRSVEGDPEREPIT